MTARPVTYFIHRSLFFKRFGPDIAFAYLQAPEAIGSKLVELLEMP